MEDQKKILIIGNKYHGKTTFANFLCSALGDARAYSTSSYLIFRLSLINGISTEAILKDKEKYRSELILLGNKMCDADAGCLVSICLWSCQQRYALIDGVRRNSEFSKVKDWFEKIVWINRPSEPIGLDNFELNTSQADVIIQNTGSLDDLKAEAEKFAKTI